MVDGIPLVPGDVAEAPTAANVSYDNTGSTLAALNVQAAVDELDGKAETNEADILTNGVAITAIDTRVGSTGSTPVGSTNSYPPVVTRKSEFGMSYRINWSMYEHYSRV